MTTAEILTPGGRGSEEPDRKRRGGMDPLVRYLLLRLALLVPTIWLLVTTVFVMMRVIGDPIQAALGGRLPANEIAIRKQEAGLDRPLWTQYTEYLSSMMRGDFGVALTDNRKVSDILIANGAATLELTFWALLVAFAIGIPLGRLAARYRDRMPDVVIRLFSILVYAAPVFYVGLLLKLAFAPFGWPSSGRASADTELTLLGVDPKTGIMIVDAILWGDPALVADVLQHALLPALALGLLTGGVFIRLVRVNLLQTSRADYVTAARARGISPARVMRKHAFRNALVPVVTVMGMQIAMLLGGAILTETTFEWQGLGYALSEYLIKRDFLAVQGIVTVIALIVGLMSFVIDVIVAFVDPRVRF